MKWPVILTGCFESSIISHLNFHGHLYAPAVEHLFYQPCSLIHEDIWQRCLFGKVEMSKNLKGLNFFIRN